MEKLRIFYLKYKHAIPLIIYGIIYMTWFAWLEKNTTGHYRIIHIAADDYIPFCHVPCPPVSACRRPCGQ